jgi:hypothetical protein
MPAFLFHQNMRVFGPNTPWRAHAYGGGAAPAWPPPLVPPPAAPAIPAGGFFAQISAGLGGEIVVAGLTEVTTYAALPVIDAFQQPLLGFGLHRTLLVACGSTALTAGKQEFLGLLFKTAGAGNQVTVLEVGRLIIKVSGVASNVEMDTAPAAPAGADPWPAWQAWAQRFPLGTIDFRSVVYAVVDMPGFGVFGVAFLHNMYTFEDQRNIVTAKLPQLMTLLRQQVVALGGVHVYLGGDFNVEPGGGRRGTARQGTLQAYTANTPPGYGAPGHGTTWNGRMYDYWYSDIVPPLPLPAGFLPQASASSHTRDSGYTAVDSWRLMSDHAAIMLQIA